MFAQVPLVIRTLAPKLLFPGGQIGGDDQNWHDDDVGAKHAPNPISATPQAALVMFMPISGLAVASPMTDAPAAAE